MKKITFSLLLVLSNYTIQAMESGSDISALAVSDSEIQEVTKHGPTNLATSYHAYLKHDEFESIWCDFIHKRNAYKAYLHQRPKEQNSYYIGDSFDPLEEAGDSKYLEGYEAELWFKKLEAFYNNKQQSSKKSE